MFAVSSSTAKIILLTLLKNRTATDEGRKQTKETVQITNGVKRMNSEGISASPPSKRRTAGEKTPLNSVKNNLRVIQVNAPATHSQNKRQNIKNKSWSR